MKRIMSVVAAFATLALRAEANHGFLSLQRYMNPGWLKGIDYNLVYLFPYVLLFLAAVDNMRLMHENKAMVATRMTGMKEYKTMEGWIITRDCLEATGIYHAVLLACTKWDIGLDVLEVMAQNILIVTLFLEIFSLAQGLGNELAFTAVIGGMALLSFSGMLAAYRTGECVKWNLLTYNVMLEQGYQGNWLVIAEYGIAAFCLEWCRRRRT